MENKEKRIREINDKLKKTIKDLKEKNSKASEELYELYKHQLPEMSKQLFLEIMATGHVLLTKEENNETVGNRLG